VQQPEIGKAATHRTFRGLCRYSQIEREDRSQGSDREETEETRHRRALFGSNHNAKVV